MGSEVTGQARPNGADAGAAGGMSVLAYGAPSTEPPPGGAPDPAAGDAAGASEESGAAAPSGEGRPETEDTHATPGEDAGAAAAAGEESDAGAAGAAEAEGEDTGAGEAGTATFRSLDELFEAAELEPDKAASLNVRIKVDGRESDVPLSDLVSSYQIRTAAEKRLADAKQKSAALEQEISTKREAAETQLAQTAKLLERAEEKLSQETRGIDWAKLREDDPDEYAAKKVELSERRTELEQLKREAVQSYQQEQQKQHQAAQAQLQQHLQEEEARLLEAIPEWRRDPAQAKAEQGRLVKYLKDQGLTDEDLRGLNDHRHVVIARKAMLYDQGRQGAAKKKIAKAPRTLRPGARASATPKPAPKSKTQLWYGT